MQRFITLVVGIAILYTVVKLNISDILDSNAVTSKDHSESQKVEHSDVEGNFFERTLSSVLINVLKTQEGRDFFEHIIQPANKPFDSDLQRFKVNNDLLASMFNIATFNNGTLGPASCGHVVSVDYKILNMSNVILAEGSKTFVLGSMPIMDGLDSVVVGMMAGQVREAVIPKKHAHSKVLDGEKDQHHDINYKVIVILKDILPHNFATKDNVKIFDDEIAYITPIMCGSQVLFDAKIYDLSTGAVIFDSFQDGKKVNMSVGDVNYPMIFSYALHNKVPIGKRTVIAKGKLFKGLGNGKSIIFPAEQLSDSSFFMLELNNFE